jgi:putative Mn2+ efflux pump MntP
MNINNEEIKDEISLLNCRKKTSLAVFRTAYAMITLPLSVFTILIATSGYYVAIELLHFIVPTIIICSLLLIIGVYLIFRSFYKIKKFEKYIKKLEEK